MAQFAPGRTPLLFLCASAIASQPAFADSGTTDSLSADDCALIENGVQRLACYDRIFEADAKRQDASDKALEKAQDSVSKKLPPSEKTPGTGSSAVQSGDEGVMNGLLDRYVAAEKAIFSFSGSFVAHRPTYILPFSWVKSPNPRPFSPRLGATGYDYDLEHEEAKYQISFKVPLLTGWLNNRTTLWFGYTQQSYWQVYNQQDSAPFRETNYEPELFPLNFLKFMLDK